MQSFLTAHSRPPALQPKSLPCRSKSYCRKLSCFKDLIYTSSRMCKFYGMTASAEMSESMSGQIPSRSFPIHSCLWTDGTGESCSRESAEIVGGRFMMKAGHVSPEQSPLKWFGGEKITSHQFSWTVLDKQFLLRMLSVMK